MRILFIVLIISLQTALYGQLEMHVSGLTDYRGFSSKKEAVSVKTYEEGKLTNEFEAGIEYHGQSSRLHPKKNYDFEIRDATGNELKQSLFGMSTGDDFVLNSLAYDGSYMRNTLIFECWKEMGYWSPDYRYLNLYIDDEYQGLYLLCEKIKVDEGRVEFEYADSTHNNYLFKLGRYWYARKAFGMFQPNDPAHLAGGFVNFKSVYPKRKKRNKADFKELSHQLSALSHELAHQKYPFDFMGKLNKGEIHMQSFIDYFLISEITKNPDAYLANIYFIIQSIDANHTRELSVGPQWDYDIALGNTKPRFFNSKAGWIYIHQSQTPRNDVVFWWNSFTNSPSYKKACQKRLNALAPIFSKENRSIRSILDSLSAVVRPYYSRDSARWNNGSVELPGNLKAHQNLDTEVNALRSFISKRVKWINANLNTLPKSNNPVHALLTRSKGSIYPIEENQLVLNYPPNDAEHEYPCYYTYELYNPDGHIREEGILGYETVSISLSTFKKGRYFLHLEQHEGYFDDPDRYLNRPAVSAVTPYEELYFRFTLE